MGYGASVDHVPSTTHGVPPGVAVRVGVFVAGPAVNVRVGVGHEVLVNVAVGVEVFVGVMVRVEVRVGVEVCVGDSVLVAVAVGPNTKTWKSW